MNSGGYIRNLRPQNLGPSLAREINIASTRMILLNPGKRGVELQYLMQGTFVVTREISHRPVWSSFCFCQFDSGAVVSFKELGESHVIGFLISVYNVFARFGLSELMTQKVLITIESLIDLSLVIFSKHPG